MIEATNDVRQWLSQWADRPYAYLTTTGRRTGQPHRIEIWFGVDGKCLYLLSGGRERSDWVRNLQANPMVTIELGDETRSGTARFIQPETTEDQQSRALLVEKYRKGDNLNEWGRHSLPIAIEFPTGPGDNDKPVFRTR